MSAVSALAETHAPAFGADASKSVVPFNRTSVVEWSLSRFESTTLAELERAELLDRVDTKFLLSESALLATLPALAHEYHVLEIQGQRAHHYRTQYFDTSDMSLYHQHRLRQNVRHKVRSRGYLDTGLAFLEVKSKCRKGRTTKHRLRTPLLLAELGSGARDFVAERALLDPASLSLVLGNKFRRVTLIHRDDAERLTLDFDLRFDAAGHETVLPGVAIAELKQDGRNTDSAFMRLMCEMNEQPMSISKYCVGVARLHPGIQHESFDPALRVINRLTQSAECSARRFPLWER